MGHKAHDGVDQRDADVAMAALYERAGREGGLWVDELARVLPSGHSIPSSAVRGRWRVNADGQLTGEFVPNPEFADQAPARCPYRPRPD